MTSVTVALARGARARLAVTSANIAGCRAVYTAATPTTFTPAPRTTTTAGPTTAIAGGRIIVGTAGGDLVMRRRRFVTGHLDGAAGDRESKQHKRKSLLHKYIQFCWA